MDVDTELPSWLDTRTPAKGTALATPKSFRVKRTPAMGSASRLSKAGFFHRLDDVHLRSSSVAALWCDCLFVEEKANGSEREDGGVFFGVKPPADAVHDHGVVGVVLSVLWQVRAGRVQRGDRCGDSVLSGAVLVDGAAGRWHEGGRAAVAGAGGDCAVQQAVCGEPVQSGAAGAGDGDGVCGVGDVHAAGPVGGWACSAACRDVCGDCEQLH